MPVSFSRLTPGRLILLALLPGLLLAPAARAAEDSSVASFSPSGDVPLVVLQARGMASDWTHVVQVVSHLRYTPKRRVVYLLGGSATRESVESESDWAAQIRRFTGTPVSTFVLATSCQTFEEDALIVQALPRGRGGVLISVGTSRFNMLHEPDAIPARTVRRNPPVIWYQHHYDGRRRLSRVAKQARVDDWLEHRYASFQEHFQDQLTALEKVIEACEERGLKCALLDMPMNTPFIGDAFSEAVKTYRASCLELAQKHGITFIRFVSGIGLLDSDFYDLQHLLKSGRAKWQTRLSREVLRKHLL
jgi:hypothetical protein